MNKSSYLVSGTPHIRASMSGEMKDLVLILSLVPAVVCAVVY